VRSPFFFLKVAVATVVKKKRRTGRLTLSIALTSRRDCLGISSGKESSDLRKASKRKGFKKVLINLEGTGQEDERLSDLIK